MSNQLFEKKGVFHSKMVAAGQFKFYVKTEPQQSKFRDEKYVPGFTEDGSEHELKMEQEWCGDGFIGMAGHWVLVNAEGRDADANISVEDLGPGQPPAGAQQPAARGRELQRGGGQRQQRQPQGRGGNNQRPADRPNRPADKPADPLPPQLTPKEHAARIANTMLLAWQAAGYVAEQLQLQRGITLTQDEIKTTASSIQIQMCYDKFHFNVQHNTIPDIHVKTKQAAK